MSHARVIQAIESICNTGCTSVSNIIQILESGKPIKETRDFSDAEINELKNELKSIMSVYENKD